MKNYECLVCDYKTVRKYNLDKHLETIAHINRKINNDTIFGNVSNTNNKIMVCATIEQKTYAKSEQNEQDIVIYKCEKCKYFCSKKSNYNRHLMSKRHISLNQEQNQEITMYDCSMCNFKCKKNSNYNIHLSSKKHIQKCNIKNCNIQNNNDKNNVKLFKNEVISTLMNQLHFVLEENKNILAEQTQTRMMIESQSKIMDEQHKMIANIANKQNISSTITNNNIKNQQFNMNVFLNETCKDAMNLSDFLENLNVSMEDMEKTGELGFAKGMSRIIMNNLNALDVCKRPIHCSDSKRETLYVKNNGVWEKETEERKSTKEIIYKVSCLNERQLIKWRDLPRNKGYDKSDHSKNDEFMNLVMEINKLRDEEIDKVITAISKHVAIDKERVKMNKYLN
jgi:hypothetical protein